MKETGKISKAVIKRLPRYRRYLEDLMKKDVDRISSNELSNLIGYTASQIRQDLNNFGGFGQQGYGYNVKALHAEISKILGLDKDYKMIIVGCGNLGQALANYTHYYKAGFIVCGMFDINPRLVGLSINDIEVMDYSVLDEYLEQNQIDIGIICTNKGSAQEVADKLVMGKVKGIWNFAAVDLDVSEEVALENVHLSDSLQSLAYNINHKDE
ncbi:MAG: redox-sensing transcriptional repressor Rex [Firmicutes bacterium]|jgi:redox-sensing transcriptional repressor|nr:redox-sensing transcriptional repressor Rex [Bacillota bacterium]MBQ2270717.1 redox-sensing transcriptional repressor Rex [Bacillota bacterium]MBQ5797152.1 redox-sensing transcriptional repressor Rex [Bacillota bacterium]MBR6500616.1 redox-sensing transcriptional repressor Rex [Bacillota bacterium]